MVLFGIVLTFLMAKQFQQNLYLQVPSVPPSLSPQNPIGAPKKVIGPKMVLKWSQKVPKVATAPPFLGPQWSFEGTNLVGQTVL